ncbi:hypothetical protein GLOIN_2v1868709 [Rhizophagus irregularis DAOM 181602=DAOM 197198]|nr:hypothetical protein GLOIN_2v1868709 [Rhizophagus irregularis DAOM 181602=DAOM 197198]
MQSTFLTNINLPPEIFIEVCSFLSPAELITLSQVCRVFRGYLCAPNSLTTQEIWKKSRLQFIPKEDIPPPKGMSEEKYVQLLMIERGCQVCKRIKECKIYWEFAIRCCHKCYSIKTVTRFELTRINCPTEFISILPYTHVGFIVCSKYYWIEQVDLAYYHYYNLSKSKKKIWLKNRKRIFDSIMNYVKQRELREYKERSFFRNWFFFPHNCDMPINSSESRFSPPPLPPSPPLFRFFANDIPQLIQYHIQRLEYESSEPTLRINEQKGDKKQFGGNFIYYYAKADMLPSRKNELVFCKRGKRCKFYWVFVVKNAI